MSVLINESYANDTANIWGKAGATSYLDTRGQSLLTGVSKAITGLTPGSTANLFLITVPADWVGKVVMLNLAGTINGVTMSVGSFANINLMVQTTNMDGGTGYFGNNFVLY